MRIISGKYKGRRIDAKIMARPTTDFAKEGLFNLLNNRIDFEDIQVLDLFSGTGSIGIECISRGCASVTAVEINEKNCAFIRKVCKDLDINNLLLYRADVFKFLSGGSIQYDLIFADPPYDLEQLKLIPDLIFSKQLLKEDGIFVLEHGAKVDFSSHPYFSFHRHYGNVNFSFFEFPIE